LFSLVTDLPSYYCEIKIRNKVLSFCAVDSLLLVAWSERYSLNLSKRQNHTSMVSNDIIIKLLNFAVSKDLCYQS